MIGESANVAVFGMNNINCRNASFEILLTHKIKSKSPNNCSNYLIQWPQLEYFYKIVQLFLWRILRLQFEHF